MKFSDFISKDDKKRLNEWFAGKEELIFFETLAKQKQPIILTPEVKLQARQHLMELMRLHGSKMEKDSSRSSTAVFIPVEIDEGFIAGITLNVIWSKLPNAVPVETMNIYIGRKTLKELVAKNQYGFKGLGHNLRFESVDGSAPDLKSEIEGSIADKIRQDFSKAKIRVGNVAKSKAALIYLVDIKMGQNIEMSDWDSAYGKIGEIMKDEIEPLVKGLDVTYKIKRMTRTGGLIEITVRS